MSLSGMRSFRRPSGPPAGGSTCQWHTIVNHWQLIKCVFMRRVQSRQSLAFPAYSAVAQLTDGLPWRRRSARSSALGRS